MQWSSDSGATLELIQGDITQQEGDAIVNAANSQLAGGGGVDGAIHRRGGPSIMDQTRQRYPEGCPTGSAVITGAGNLLAKYVIHAVGPVWSGGERNEGDLLRSAYQSCLALATEYECQSIVFPSLSTGAYRYPIKQASEIALSTCLDYLKEVEQPKRIVFALFDQVTLQAFSNTLQRLTS